jgi:hypothetical protein
VPGARAAGGGRVELPAHARKGDGVRLASIFQPSHPAGPREGAGQADRPAPPSLPRPPRRGAALVRSGQLCAAD